MAKKPSPVILACERNDVVGAVGPEEAGFPIDGARIEYGLCPTQSRFVGVRHDLLQRRIGDKRIFKKARPVWIGAIEFERRRRAVRLGVAAVDGDRGQDFIGQANHRIDPRESVVDVEFRRLARGILGDDLSDIEPCAGGQGELRRDVKGVKRVDAIIRRSAGEKGWHFADSSRGADDVARAWEGTIADDQIGEDGAKLAGRAETQQTAVDAGAKCEIILVLEEFVVIGCLQRRAEGRRMDGGAIDGPVNRARRERDRLAVADPK